MPLGCNVITPHADTQAKQPNLSGDEYSRAEGRITDFGTASKDLWPIRLCRTYWEVLHILLPVGT